MLTIPPRRSSDSPPLAYSWIPLHGPDRTGPDQTKSAHFVWYHTNHQARSTARYRPSLGSISDSRYLYTALVHCTKNIRYVADWTQVRLLSPRTFPIPAAYTRPLPQMCDQSCPWVGLDWVRLGRDLSVLGGLGWVGSTIARILKFRKDYVNAFKARLGKIWLHQAVKFVSRIGLGPNFSTCNGLGWVRQLTGWVGSGHTQWTDRQLRVWRTNGRGHQRSAKSRVATMYDT